MKTEALTVRPATAEDSEAAIHIISEVYNEYDLIYPGSFGWYPDGYHADLYDLQTHYFDQSHKFWIAELNRKPIGTCAVHIFPTAEYSPDPHKPMEGTDCSLERMYVLSEARGHGVGRALMATAIKGAKEAGCTCMEIWSDKRFETAHALYQKFGAKIVGERLCHDPEQSPEWGLKVIL